MQISLEPALEQANSKDPVPGYKMSKYSIAMARGIKYMLRTCIGHFYKEERKQVVVDAPVREEGQRWSLTVRSAERSQL